MERDISTIRSDTNHLAPSFQVIGLTALLRIRLEGGFVNLKKLKGLIEGFHKPGDLPANPLAS
jgi:hypothetical protein